ncbi:MAG: AraC family transcriptional regulator [Pseudomonadota bacterium]
MKTALFNIHDLILVLTLAVCFLLMVFQLLLSRQKTIASYLLSGFFLCVGANALCNLLLWNNYIHLHSFLARYFLVYGLAISVIGKGIFLFWYVQAITRENFALTPQKMLHSIALAIVLVMLISADVDSDALRFLSVAQTSPNERVVHWLWHLLKIIPVIYAIAVVIIAQRYKQYLKNFYSNLQLQGPEGLMLLTLGFAVSWGWSLLVHILGQFLSTDLVDSFGIAENYITFVLLNALFLYSLLYAHELIETKVKIKEKESSPTPAPNKNAIERIQQAMEIDQLYLKHNLNIETFSKKIDMNYREVSSIINNHFGTNFFEFVNEYRVNKAKAMLIDPIFAEKTILYILLECGFNSKSSFHRFFKRYTNMTAADFRKEQASNSNINSQIKPVN